MKEEHSIAAVVYYEDQYLLLKYGLGHWGFVKGHKEKGESNEETILRELEEETGIIDVKIIGDFKKDFEYYFKFKGEKIHKSVTCYLIESKTSKVILSYEHEDYIWLPIEKALNQATFDNSKKILRKAAAYLKSNLDSFLN
ncbi:MAG: NUDIX domain-containing protein [Candidatus Lokiarchaeota archaeon]|nr:NUDIX domain-containing protein [Candidatus Lokiarchaeota archaeon]